MHDSEKSAADFLINIWPNIDLWWYSDSTQKIIKEYSKKYCLKKFLVFTFILLSTQAKVYSAEKSYIFGGAKIFNYGIEKSDLRELNTSLVALGFSSSASSTDNSGIGFDVGIGVEIAPNFSIEGSYVNYGTLEIKTKSKIIWNN